MRLSDLPEPWRDPVETILAAEGWTRALVPVPGGASGALAFRFGAEGRERLLRLSDPTADRMRNPDQHACLEAAARAGVAPRLSSCDPGTGVLVMDFIRSRPLSSHPGGPLGLASHLGRLIRKLQSGPRFPNAVNFGERLAGMMAVVRGASHFQDDLLAPWIQGLEDLCAAYPWGASAPVAAHCDPNPRNLLFDGERLWLVDWETACATDAMVDLAILTLETVIGPEAETALLEAWLGQAPGQGERDRLALMKPLVRLYYGLLMLVVTPPPAAPSRDISALDPGEFAARVGDGRLPMGSPEMMTALAKITLAGFRADLEAPGLAEAMRRRR
ncbi:MAG: hypothetical protein RL588_2413 [Pseudomonadota bacterium]|jgi:hypothetical protein